jgi:hypothetical protein
MKKNLSLVIGLALVVGAVVSFSEASRDAYHAYLNGYSRFNTYKGGDAWSKVKSYRAKRCLLPNFRCSSRLLPRRVKYSNS